MQELNKWIPSVILFLLLGSLASCELGTTEESEKDRLLAQVGSKSLYISEMEGMFPEGLSGQDSLLVIESYVGRWVREAAILNEAERNIPADLNINKMVRDYRASLVRSSYEKILVEQLLDSVVTKQKLEEFYEENQMLYELQKPIARCLFIKVPIPTPEGDRLRNLWNKAEEGDLAALRAYCDQYAEVALLKEDLWYAVEEVAEQLPVGTLTVGNIGSKREFTQRDEHHQYYFRLFELKNRKEIAPLSYVEEQARKVILHKRKLQLVEEVKEDIYQRELREKNVETFY
ncbi:hypothetical protein [Lewinella cohaerens]|uniref:hypothetical protein n=1 Tax=Lewinella cohaerens TaxID=70995 RepID=UPI00035F7B5A|nr:hypothetical protein [Lewinella cohaerens]